MRAALPATVQCKFVKHCSLVGDAKNHQGHFSPHLNLDFLGPKMAAHGWVCQKDRFSLAPLRNSNLSPTPLNQRFPSRVSGGWSAGSLRKMFCCLDMYACGLEPDTSGLFAPKVKMRRDSPPRAHTDEFGCTAAGLLSTWEERL